MAARLLRSCPQVLWALVSIPLAAASCTAPGPAAGPVVPALASEAFGQARELRAKGAQPDDPQLLQVLAEARALAPDWVPPQRMEDDLMLSLRRGPDALDRRRASWSLDPRDGAATYLVARLEGGAQNRRFAQAVALEPGLAWAQHGLSWSLGQARQEQPALEHAGLALELARDPWERAYFQLALARRLRTFRREPAALELLRGALDADTGLRPRDRAWFAAEVAMFELSSPDFTQANSGYVRGLELIRRGALLDADLTRLTEEMLRRPVGVDFSKLELELALASHDSDLRRELRASALLERSDSQLAARLFERERVLEGDSLARAVTAELSRVEAFRRGLAAQAIEHWLEDLPAQVRSDDGLPTREVLRDVVLRARGLSDPPEAQEWSALGEALLAAGWFPEAQAVSEQLAALDLDAALSLRERAAAGRVLIEGLAKTLLDVERGREDLAASVSFDLREDQATPSGGEPDRDSEQAPASSGSLDDLLGRWAALFARSAPWLGGERDEDAARASLARSPRMEYGPFATVLHPGPVFSAFDESSGLGREGDAVPGLAPRLERYGRFAIVGQVLGGGGPDGTLLRLLSLEEREGQHLGVSWRGTIAWCDGADLLSRAGRQGARISGAALHEGYWIDVASIRRDRDRWRALRESFDGRSGAGRLEAALAVRGLALLTPPRHADRRRQERLTWTPLLGESDRVRLAVLRDRAGEGELLGEVALTELVEAVATHEEGHLCDRARFFPIQANLGRILKFVLDVGFSATAIQAELEYRAHLTALCAVPDPRLPLAEMLDMAEAGSAGGLPHGAAYAGLLSDLLEVLDQRVQGRPEEWPHIDPNRTLAHQLHQLTPEELRGVGLALAARRGWID